MKNSVKKLSFEGIHIETWTPETEKALLVAVLLFTRTVID